MIEVFFDCSSPWTYLAFANLRRLAAELEVEIKWRPILVGGIFNTINPSVYAQRADPVPAKARYMGKDLADWARHAGLRIRFPPSVFPVNSVKAMRGCILLEPQGKLVDFAAAAFEAGQKERIVISEFPSLEQAIAAYNSPAYKEALKALGDGAVRDIRIFEGTD